MLKEIVKYLFQQRRACLLALAAMVNCTLLGQVSPEERLALQDFYLSTNGPQWFSENDADITNNWDFTGPVTDNWAGIRIAGGHVVSLNFDPLNLNRINVESANNLTGILPNSIGDLQWLQIFNLSRNALMGEIPEGIGRILNLRGLNLSRNSFTGEIPADIWDVVSLEVLTLRSNQLRGEIPVSISNLLNLSELDLGDNNFIGEIPIEITQLVQLQFLSLGENQFSGIIYPEYAGLINLQWLFLNENNLTGQIPEELGQLVNLTSLSLGGQELTGTLPVSLRSLVNLRQLNIRDTSIDGEIPEEFGELVNLTILRLSGNQLSGSIPDTFENLTQLKGLILFKNQLSGEIPDGLSNLLGMTDFLVFDNNLTGTIPQGFSNMLSMVNFDVSNNNLGGSIPMGFSNFQELMSFSVENNNFEGTIPNLTNSSELIFLLFQNNKFQFGDFETQFNYYFNNILNFSYSPQDKINDVEFVTVNLSDNLTLITTASGEENHYQWFKDGTLIDGALDSPAYVIGNAQFVDAGVYSCLVTSDIVAGLTLMRNEITIVVNCEEPNVDKLEDVLSCYEFELPALSENNFYYTQTNKGGLQLFEGDIITKSQTIYIYSGIENCFSESSFNVVIDSSTSVDVQSNVEVCSSFILPPLVNGNYYTETNGAGKLLYAGSSITDNATIYIYAEPSEFCVYETSFTVVVNKAMSASCVDSCDVVFPTFFTPNNDGVNDYFGAVDNPCSYTGNVNVFNQYGKLLFQFDIIEGNWDGNLNGKKMIASDYWYIFKDSESEFVLKGHFTLKR